MIERAETMANNIYLFIFIAIRVIAVITAAYYDGTKTDEGISLNKAMVYSLLDLLLVFGAINVAINQ